VRQWHERVDAAAAARAGPAAPGCTLKRKLQIAAYGGGRGVSVPLPLRALGLPPYLELGLLYQA
jgi:hypothetical protein